MSHCFDALVIITTLVLFFFFFSVDFDFIRVYTPTILQDTVSLQEPSERHSILVPPVNIYPGLQVTLTVCPYVVEVLVKSTRPFGMTLLRPQSTKR